MSLLRRLHCSADAARRWVALGGSAIILVLSVLAANPELHQFLHGHDDSGLPDSCAVVQFASGVAMASDSAVLSAVPAVWHVTERAAPADVLRVADLSLHPPGRGPPAA